QPSRSKMARSSFPTETSSSTTSRRMGCNITGAAQPPSTIVAWTESAARQVLTGWLNRSRNVSSRSATVSAVTGTSTVTAVCPGMPGRPAAEPEADDADLAQALLPRRDEERAAAVAEAGVPASRTIHGRLSGPLTCTCSFYLRLPFPGSSTGLATHWLHFR